MLKIKNMNRWAKTIIFGNIYCLLFWVLGALFGFHMVKIANGLFYSIAAFIIVGLIALLNPKRVSMGRDEKIKKLTIKEMLTTGEDLVSKGYRLFLYCFIISIIISAYSYVIYEIGARSLGI